MTDRTGQCQCGAVRYVLRDAAEAFTACHCTICQRTSGGINLAFSSPAERTEITGAEHVRSYRSSDWAERSFCGICGSNLWYRSTLPEDQPAEYSIGLGTLDDTSGMRLVGEICIETKPAAYDLAGDHPRQSSAEALG